MRRQEKETLHFWMDRRIIKIRKKERGNELYGEGLGEYRVI